MKRISIVGNGGSGKTTLSYKLSRILNIPVYHLDQYFWKANWQKVDTELWFNSNREIVSKSEWIIDGNYRSCMDMRFETADIIIFMDLPRYKCYYNIIKRYIKYRGKVRPDMTDECDERIDKSFIKYLWTYPKQMRPQLIKKLENHSGKKIVILKNPQQVNKFLVSIKG